MSGRTLQTHPFYTLHVLSRVTSHLWKEYPSWEPPYNGSPSLACVATMQRLSNHDAELTTLTRDMIWFCDSFLMKHKTGQTRPARHSLDHPDRHVKDTDTGTDTGDTGAQAAPFLQGLLAVQALSGWRVARTSLSGIIIKSITGPLPIGRFMGAKIIG